MDEHPTGKALGGLARAAKLTREERSEIAKNAAKKRWADLDKLNSTTPRVLESFKSTLTIAGAVIPCAIVMGSRGVQRVLSETGITNAILGTRSGASKRLKKAASDLGAPLPLFVAPSQLKSFINKDLLEGPLKPIDYLDGERLVRGYDASILAAVCNIWLKARRQASYKNSNWIRPRRPKSSRAPWPKPQSSRLLMKPRAIKMSAPKMRYKHILSLSYAAS